MENEVCGYCLLCVFKGLVCNRCLGSPLSECLGCTHWVGKLRHISPRVCLSLRCPCLSHTTPPFKKKKKKFFFNFLFYIGVQL